MFKDDLSEAVLGYLETRREELVDFVCQLVATPSINPPGDERAVVDVILTRMVSLGLDGAEVLGKTPERPNLIYHRRGQTGSPCLILNGHTDTKPVGEEDRRLWRSDPLVPTIVDGRLYGLGSTDMKGAVAALVYAVAALHALGDVLNGDLLLILTADEEAGSGLGANWLVNHRDLRADFCLVAEPSGMTTEFENIAVSARRMVRFRTKVYGTQMHSSISDRFPSVNASVKMAWVLWRMATDLELRFEPHPLYPKGPTVNLGDFVTGGIYYGVYPGYAEFGSDIRLLPGMTHENLRQDLESFLARLCREDPDLKVELGFEDDGREQQWPSLRGDEPFVSVLQEACQSVLGRKPPLGGFPAFTDAYWFHTHAGIPAIPAFGPGLLPLAHGPNEYVSVDGIVQASKVYALAALEYLR